MPAKPKTAGERQARLQHILAALDKLYPNVTCALDHSNAWELLVATILSAQCTDKRVNMVTPGLFRKYPTIRDFAAASQEEERGSRLIASLIIYAGGRNPLKSGRTPARSRDR